MTIVIDEYEGDYACMRVEIYGCHRKGKCRFSGKYQGYLHAERMDFHSYLFIIVNPGITNEKVLNNVELVNSLVRFYS